MTDGSDKPVGSRRGDYVWDGSQWVPYRDGTGNTFDGRTWNRPPQPPPSAPQPVLFADPRYAYGLTRQTSDDLQFIARYLKIVIIVGLVLAGLVLLADIVLMGSLFTLLQSVFAVRLP